MPAAIRSLCLSAQEAFPQIIYHELLEKIGDIGCTPCDIGIEKATGDVVFFIGDDDICTEQAFDIIRTGIKNDLTVPHVFAMLHTGHRLAGTIEVGRVSGQQIVVPRDMSKMPKMAACPSKDLQVSDAVFITAVVSSWGTVKFHDGIIAILDRQNHGRTP